MKFKYRFDSDGIKMFMRNAIARVGLDVRRIRNEVIVSDPFYKVSPSCQIPELSQLYDLFLGQRSDGYFVEVGAFDGESFSNSSCLADKGWGGLLIEPVPEFAKRCGIRHKSNKRISVVEAAVGVQEGWMQMVVAGALSSGNSKLLKAYSTIPWAENAMKSSSEIRVPVRRLDNLLEEAGEDVSIDLLIVDTEGTEADVFASFDLARWRPAMIIVELCDTHKDLSSVAAGDRYLLLDLTEKKYLVVYRDQINTILVRQDIYLNREVPAENSQNGPSFVE